MASAAETDTQAEIVANTSGITPDSLKATLKEKLQASHVDINDMSGEAPAFSPPTPPPRKFEPVINLLSLYFQNWLTPQNFT